MLKVQIKILHNDIEPPAYATVGSAGFDLVAAISENLVVQQFARVLVPTGISILLPDGYEAQVRPRSGLAIKHGVTVLNTPGTIDSDYTGEIKVILFNSSSEPFEITPGMRIAQCIVSKYEKVEWIQVDELAETIRGSGGFGSSGTHVIR